MEQNKIYNADCIQTMKQMESGSVDLVLTDPPYGIDFVSSFRNNSSKLKFEKIQGDNNLNWMPEFIKETHRILKDNSAFYFFTRFDVYPEWYQETMKYFDVKNLLIIKRKHAGMGDLKCAYAFKYEMCVFAVKGKLEYNKLNEVRAKRIDPRKKYDSTFANRYPDLIDWIDATEFNLASVHPTQKNIDIMRFFMRMHSGEGDVVFDGFMGSGTTALACIKEKRNYIGCEIEEGYFNTANELIKNELSQLTLW